MITALIGSLVGMLGGVLPDIIKVWMANQTARNEREFLKLQAETQRELAKIGQTTRLGEISSNETIAHIQASKDTLLSAIEMSLKPSGIPWVDGLNAAMRPLCTYILIGLFTIVTAVYSGAIMWDFITNSIDAATAGKLLYGGLVGEFYMAVFSFTFGYRSTVKASGK